MMKIMKPANTRLNGSVHLFISSCQITCLFSILPLPSSLFFLGPGPLGLAKKQCLWSSMPNHFSGTTFFNSALNDHVVQDAETGQTHFKPQLDHQVMECGAE